MALKRTVDVANLDEIDGELRNAELHFGVEMLSPMQKSKSGYEYFNGQVSDGTKKLRLVGFDSECQEHLTKFVEKKTPVKATHCSIRKSRTTEELEVHVNKGTTFAQSPRKLNFDCVQPPKAVAVNITEARAMDDGALVNLTAQVFKVAPGRTVSTGIVQEVTLKDETGEMDLTLWNNNVDIVFEHNTYNFTTLIVNTNKFRNMKILTFTNRSSILKSEDMLQLPVDGGSSAANSNIAANLVGIQDYHVHFWCIKCDSKLKYDEDFAHCENCLLLQLIKSCKYQVTTKLMFRTIPTENSDDEPQYFLLNTSTEVFLKLLKITITTGEGAAAHITSDKRILKIAENQPFSVTHDGFVITDIQLL